MQIFECLEDEKSFLSQIKSFFIVSEGLSLVKKNSVHKLLPLSSQEFLVVIWSAWKDERGGT